MSLLILIIFAIAFAEWFAENDFKDYTIGFIYQHWDRALMRLVVLIIASIWAAWHHDGHIRLVVLEVFSRQIFIPITCVLYLGLSCTVFWIWFEYRFNYMLDETDPYYIGNTAWSDRMFRKFGIRGLQLFYFKICLAIVILVAIFAT